ncbi:hypothetical protein PHYBOEH_002772 [Phytophthora boehmeriae]|uniref:Peptidase C19 ubiquitin carboxyl-terminal hydrolase domain-containing protein n=1 Tax=Phytophthora boehmeriae TaxID=109152 RepID=A0A8T1WQE9_9STRA|nr:hypothetical protein PHYBOEH_002772 [Phytophthora boehmeriae]
MSSWREASLVGNSSVRAKSRFPWLLLLWWSQATLWLRRWLKIYLRRPLMRLGIVSTDSNDQTKGELPENDVDASSSDGKNRHTESELPCGLVNTSNLCFVNAVLQCLAAVPRFVDSVDRALRTRTQLHAPLVTQSDDDQVQKLLVAETLVSVLRGISAVGEDEETRELEQEQMQMQVENGGKRRRTEGRQGFGGTRRDDTMQRMRRFRAAASRCTYLVSSAVSRQEQQDAEVR